MSKPLIVSIPHRLGKEEALRRLKAWGGPERTLVICSVSKKKSGTTITCNFGSVRSAR
jgi:hypothetical protein